MSCSEWKEYRLEELIINYNSKRKPLSSRQREGCKGVYPYYGAQGIIDYLDDYIFDGEYLLIAEDGNNLKERKEDIARIAKGKFWVNNHAHIITNNKMSDMRFLKYYLNTLDISAYITGSAQPKLNKANLSNIKIKAPSLEEQEKIANILSSLDDKIELNNEMNKTLEEMAQSIFKRWFVDFEFHNEDGEPYKSSGGEMVESELGMIPKGWEVKTIGDIGNIITGKTPSSKIEGCFGNEYKFITPRDISDSVFILKTERELSSIGADKLKRNIVPQNSIGVSCIGSNLGEVYIAGEDSITNQQINTVVLNENTLFPYVYIYLKNMKEDFLNMSSGSAVPIINKTSFSKINILVPNKNLLNQYVKVTTCYFDRIKENIKENESLIILRDILLPKLMSGEISV